MKRRAAEWTISDTRVLEDMYDWGDSVDEIARKLNFSKSLVRKKIRELGLRHRRPIDQELLARSRRAMDTDPVPGGILHEFSLGANIREISEKYGKGRKNVSRTLREHGIDPRRKSDKSHR